ncbi:hypothetical protein GCM10009641_77190 [Mycobacterium cookii]|uniref:SnoaL-like domain-containing protein n=1 Tax=Nocardioides furvisabuli TaxID=375542 RepID=A0ABN2XDG7_9ACTN|nr:hypothetical protein [Nocardioides furvisabuli]
MDPRRLLPVLTALACACVVATLVVTVARPGETPTGSSGPAAARPAEARPSAARTPGPGSASAVLATWDARRSAAWAAGDVDALAGLYADGSRTGAADVRLLRHYRDRGLTVEGLTTQLLAVAVVRREQRRLVLDVTDRVVAGQAVGGTRPVALPTDRASTRRVVLVRPGRAWLVAEARDQASAAASTSRTSSSSKS